MNTTKIGIKSFLGTALFLTLFSFELVAQEFNLNNETSQLSVSGTSSLHDWHVDAEKQKGSIVLDLANELVIKKLYVEIIAESLKSGKKGMDKNTYKALNTSQHKSITYQMLEVKQITKQGETKYAVKTVGNLSVAGTTKKVTLDFELQLTANKVTLKGEKSFKMTEFGIEPPKALLGTITTGDEITIKFNTTLNN